MIMSPTKAAEDFSLHRESIDIGSYGVFKSAIAGKRICVSDPSSMSGDSEWLVCLRCQYIITQNELVGTVSAAIRCI